MGEGLLRLKTNYTFLNPETLKGIAPMKKRWDSFNGKTNIDKELEGDIKIKTIFISTPEIKSNNITKEKELFSKKISKQIGKSEDVINKNIQIARDVDEDVKEFINS